MSELPPEIQSQLQKLTQKQAFTQSIEQLVRAGINALCNSGDEYSQKTCPTALLLAFSHCYCNNMPLSSLASEMPEGVRQTFISCCQKYQNLQPPQFKQEGLQQLIDVQWSINISFGREMWNVILKFDSGRHLKMVLNYELLSVLVFKLGQAVSYVQNYQV